LLLATAAALILAPIFVLAVPGCDDKPEEKQPGDNKSVIEGGTPESAAGRKVEDAKQKIEGAEKQLQDRDDRIFDQSAGEQAPRGVP
jgi:hypothetical protein